MEGQLNNYPERFYSSGEYIVGDSGYISKKHIIGAYKGTLTPAQTKFNYHLSKLRVVSEHCLGMMKMRFQSLRGLRGAINGVRDMGRLNLWIMACAVLHNYLLDEEQLSFWDDEDMESLQRQWELEAEQNRQDRIAFDLEFSVESFDTLRGNNQTRSFIQKACERRDYAPAYH